MKNKYAKDKETWNSSNYDLIIDADRIPRNVYPTNLIEIQKLADKYFPCTKKVNVIYNKREICKDNDKVIFSTAANLKYINNKNIEINKRIL